MRGFEGERQALTKTSDSCNIFNSRVKEVSPLKLLLLFLISSEIQRRRKINQQYAFCVVFCCIISIRYNLSSQNSKKHEKGHFLVLCDSFLLSWL